MYKLLKERGGNSLITIRNEDTGDSVIMGKPNTMPLQEKIRELFPSIDIFAPWDEEVPADKVEELTHVALRMHKPKRVNKDVKSTSSIATSTGTKSTDIFDMIFGIGE